MSAAENLDAALYGPRAGEEETTLDHKIREARAAVPPAAPAESIADLIARAAALSGVSLDAGARAERCEGGCGLEVARRHAWCTPCADASRLTMRRLSLAPAVESVSPGGALDWCRVAGAEYKRTTSKARLRGVALHDDRAIRLVDEARWKRNWGSLLLLGPTGIGKSKIVVAVALRILDVALDGKLAESDFHAAMGLRFVSGLDLARAQAKHKLGDGDPPLVAEAKRASLLLLDEIGYEEQRLDPHAIRDVLHTRDDRNLPTLVTSGRTRAELDERYGAAAMRRLTEVDRSTVIDLHPRAGERIQGPHWSENR